MIVAECSGVTFGYGSHILFKDCSFTLKQGEFTWLIGKSGSGKTTLLQLLAMALTPQQGTVAVAGFRTGCKPSKLPLLRRKIGIIFQEFRLLSDRNIFENLAFVLEVTGTPAHEIKRRVTTALADVGLQHKWNAMPSQLSGGEQQRVAIARAVLNGPLLILADEPTGNLDMETSVGIMEILRKINQKGTAVLIATHNFELVKKFPSTVIKIDEGKISLHHPVKSV